jgi:hypothetical protein
MKPPPSIRRKRDTLWGVAYWHHIHDAVPEDYAALLPIPSRRVPNSTPRLRAREHHRPHSARYRPAHSLHWSSCARPRQTPSAMLARMLDLCNKHRTAQFIQECNLVGMHEPTRRVMTFFRSAHRTRGPLFAQRSAIFRPSDGLCCFLSLAAIRGMAAKLTRPLRRLAARLQAPHPSCAHLQSCSERACPTWPATGSPWICSPRRPPRPVLHSAGSSRRAARLRG